MTQKFETIEESMKHFYQELKWYDKVEIFLCGLIRVPWNFVRYDFWNGIKNFWRYKAVIWRHRWYDYSLADDVMAEMYKDRLENWKYSYHLHAHEDEKYLKIIVELFKRLKETDTLTVEDDEEDRIRKEIYRLIARKRLWD